MPKTDAAALTARIEEVLRQQREHGSDAYPLTRMQLVALVEPATPEQIAKVLAKKAFAARLVMAVAKRADSPLALAEDADRLADSPLLLKFALGLLCTAEAPLHTPAEVVRKVAKSLQPAFKAALRRRLDEQTLPEGVASILLRSKRFLYLTRFPPPPPPDVVLSGTLVRVLEVERSRGEDAYPVPLARLFDLADAKASPTLRKQALAREPFAGSAVVGVPGRPDSPVMLTADRDRLAAHPLLLETALTVVIKPDNQAVTLADLKKKVAKALQPAFEVAVLSHIERGALPPAVGSLRIKKKLYLYLRTDVPGPLPAPFAPPVVDFARRFEEAFDQLDAYKGSHNLVSLVDLRRALVMERTAFDARLQELRRAGRYSLSAAEGRHGVTPEERDAGIVEDGTLLLFVSRRGER
jgi:hypothetical protein